MINCVYYLKIVMKNECLFLGIMVNVEVDEEKFENEEIKQN